jgi:hypothetical protein
VSCIYFNNLQKHIDLSRETLSPSLTHSLYRMIITKKITYFLRALIMEKSDVMKKGINNIKKYKENSIKCQLISNWYLFIKAIIFTTYEHIRACSINKSTVAFFFFFLTLKNISLLLSLIGHSTVCVLYLIKAFILNKSITGMFLLS